MPGWKKACLSVLDRAGGSSSGSLQVQGHVQGLHSPSSSSSSLASYKRAGKYGGGHVSSKAVVGCFSAVLALALAFFYVTVTSEPATGAADSFPSPTTSSSSSGILMSSLSSNTSRTSPPAVTAGGAADDDQSDARNATVASRRVRSSAMGGLSASASEVSSVQATSVPGQKAKTLVTPPLQDAGNATVGSDAEPAGNGTREEEPQVETATPMLRWRRTDTDGASSFNSSVVGSPGQTARNNTDIVTGNSTDTVTSSSEEAAENAAVDNVQTSARQPAVPSRPEKKDYRHRHRRIVRRRHPRRRKETVLPVQDPVAGQSDGEASGAKATMTLEPDNNMAGANTSIVVGPGSGASASMGVAGAGNTRIVWTSGVQDLVSFAKCDVFNGRWVRDESYGFYPPKSCALIDDDFNCHKNGRPDSDYLKWRWQPQGCDIPRYSYVTFLNCSSLTEVYVISRGDCVLFTILRDYSSPSCSRLNATEFLERLRGQRIIFVGDSLNRNMWESLVCILRHGVRDKRNVYEASGKNQFKTRGYYSFRFRVQTFAHYMRTLNLISSLTPLLHCRSTIARLIS
jgi:hypothetical protein